MSRNPSFKIDCTSFSMLISVIIITYMRKKVKVKALQGTPYLISLEEPIGSGSFGSVFRAYQRDDPSKQLAVKVIPLQEKYK